MVAVLEHTAAHTRFHRSIGKWHQNAAPVALLNDHDNFYDVRTVKNLNTGRSWLTRSIARFWLTADIGVIILFLIGIVTVTIIGVRLYKRSNATELTVSAGREIAGAGEGEITGQARVIDGDTLEIAGQKVRIFGIDAPERGQVCRDGSDTDYGCGIRASAHVDNLVSGLVISCHMRAQDRYGRIVAVCSVRGKDLGREIVAAGWAVAFERYSRDYVTEQNYAREKRLGLWQGSFENPSAVRAH